MAAPNMANLATITGRTAVQAVSTTPTDIISNGGSSNAVVKINGLIVSNVNGTTAATVNASVFRSSTEFKVAHLISVPAGATLVLLDKTTSLYLEEGDSLRLTASANSFLHAVSSYEIIG
jgi:hypothetical protein